MDPGDKAKVRATKYATLSDTVFYKHRLKELELSYQARKRARGEM